MAVWMGLAFSALVFGELPLHGQQSPVFEIDFKNAQLLPSHWTLKINPDGSGQFDAEGDQTANRDPQEIWAGDVHRPVQLSAAFTEKVFSTAKMRRWFAYPCESRMKVAFQGIKRLSYSGPDGSGACEYNYSKDKEIEELGNSLMGVEFTIMSGARMEKLLQHDRLGLDKELDALTDALKDGSATETGVIREMLNRIASDDAILERARRKARLLLTESH
jgi:hypothetical protein